MDAVDLEVVNVLFFQQMLDAVEYERWDEAAMALYKLYAIEDGERFTDLDLPERDGDADLTPTYFFGERPKIYWDSTLTRYWF